jgi:RNA recognition motif-containing protein
MFVLFVQNIPYSASSESLKKFLVAKLWGIESVRVIQNEDTGVSRGFGFVTFNNDIDMGEALLLSKKKNLQFLGRDLQLERARPR